jgi:putative DNA primase/helicase
MAKDNIVKLVDEALAPDPFTDDALALRFSELHQNDLRFIATKNTWLKWDGARWLPEPTHLAFDLARQSCRSVAQEFGNGKPPAQVYSAKTIATVERMAKADRRHATTLEEWDSADHIFNTSAAAIDLHTGLGRPPDPADKMPSSTATDLPSRRRRKEDADGTKPKSRA